MARENGEVNGAYHDVEAALIQRDGEGPIPTRGSRALRVVMVTKVRGVFSANGNPMVYDTLDIRLMETLDAESPAAGRRVKGGAISAAKINAREIAKQHGARMPGVNGNR